MNILGSKALGKHLGCVDLWINNISICSFLETFVLSPKVIQSFFCFLPLGQPTSNVFWRRCHVIQLYLIKIENILNIIHCNYCMQSGSRNSNATSINIIKLTTKIMTHNCVSSLEFSQSSRRKFPNHIPRCQKHP